MFVYNYVCVYFDDKSYYPMIYGVWAFVLIGTLFFLFISFRKTTLIKNIGRYGNVNFGVLYGIIAVFAGIVNLIFANMLNRYENNENFIDKNKKERKRKEITLINRISLSHHSYVFANALLAGIGMVFVLYPLLSLIRGKLYRNKYASGYYEPIINS